jgi:hemerythrin-like domain-containing protein
MPIAMGSLSQPDFDQPIDLMMDCHRRIERFLDVLQKVVERYAHQPLDALGYEALQTALNYFQSAAPRHTADEEQSLFPRLRVLDDPQIRQAMAVVDQLESDHRRAEAAHAQLDVLGRRWLEDGELAEGLFGEFCSVLDDLSAGYRRHIPIEDGSVFVLAKRVLEAQELLAIGQEMKQRRIDDPGRAGSLCAARRQALARATSRRA